ncbi:MAG: 4Fe-4S dicluster domain-containing protein [Anaerovoracaceae bacterium]
MSTRNVTPADMQTGEDMIAFVACAGDAAGKERFKDCKSCQEAVDSGFKRGECKSGCVGIGSCIDSCKEGAMSLVDGKIVIDESKCNGCGDCAKPEVCPQALIRMIPREATNFIPCSSTEEEEEKVRATCNYGCIGCGECQRACPEGAIDIINNHAVIDYDKCVGCVACTVKCKKKIIVDKQHELAEIKEKVSFVGCSGGYKINNKMQELGYTDCKVAKENVDLKELGLCTTGCFGLGNCTRVCRYDAIEVKNGTAVVDPAKCVDCRDCIFECPQNIIRTAPYKGMKFVPCSSTDDYKDKAAVCDSGCIACEDCIRNCPNQAIYMDEKHAVIDSDLCEDCEVCQYMCARLVIDKQEVPEYNYLQREALGLREGE